MEENYISIKEIATRWNISLRQMQVYCKNGRIPGARKIDNAWVVPENAERPENIRNLSGEKRRQSIKKRETDATVDMKFLALMSHEIRSSLNTILGCSQMIENQKKLPEEILEYARNIQTAGRSLLSLANNAMDVAKLNAGELKVEESVFNIESMLYRLVNEQKKFAENHQITIKVKTDLAHEYVYGDEEKIKRILSNILNNAIKYSRNGQTVLLKVEENQNEKSSFSSFKYVVEDHGSGMSEYFLDHVFDLFSQDKSSPIQELKGTGFGMTIAKQLADLLGGDIKIESHVDYGTRVEITLENRQADISDFQIEEQKTFDDSKLKGKRILVAEDNELNRDIVTQVLKNAGMEVEEAEDGIICIAMLEKMPSKYYDLILMDLSMPNLDGIVAAKLIRGLSDETKSNIPIVAITANVDSEDKYVALQAGMNGFVEKPFDSKNLLEIIAGCMEM